ncbi:MAG: 7-cyano-7-deazaguanine synthase QueC [Oceanospirillaceae bacterium]|nr:7-cyano-7-deazaguanine synthase QueC [Oceanospirillaceae bacterium]
MNSIKTKAVILLSGGLDSATVLEMAKEQGYDCYALSFDYGQRSLVELDAARALASAAGVVEHKVLRMPLEDFGGSALTDDSIAMPEDGEQDESEVPVTYVPARNTVFLSLALGWAEVLEASAIFIGVNSVDYSGYPDCRPEYIEAFEKMANLATRAGIEGNKLTIATPLMTLTKGEIIQRGIALGIDYKKTVSCYQADARGYACNHCDSCKLRKEGFVQAGIEDQTHYF